MQDKIEQYQNDVDKGPIFTCEMLASTTCADICDDVQLKGAHVLSMYREGFDVTVLWTSREGEKKTLDGTLLKVWTRSQSVVTPLSSETDKPVAVCANPRCKGPLPKRKPRTKKSTAQPYGMRFTKNREPDVEKQIIGDLAGLCNNCFLVCCQSQQGDGKYEAMKEAIEAAGAGMPCVTEEGLFFSQTTNSSCISGGSRRWQVGKCWNSPHDWTCCRGCKTGMITVT